MRQGIRIFSLTCAAMLSLAIMAAGAHATGELRVAGKVLAKGEKAEIIAEGSEYKSLIPGLGLTLECTSAKISGIAENVGGQARGEGKVLAHGCKIAGNPVCIIYPTEKDLVNKTNAGLVLGSSGNISVRSIGSERYLEGSASAMIYHGGGGCTLPEETIIEGSAAGKIVEATTEAVSHTVTDITEKEEKELGVAAFYGEEPLFIDQGTAVGQLAGKFAGMKFSVN